MGKILILEKRTIEKVDEHNFAFIDAQNLYKSLIKSGWKLDYFKFRKYLQKKFGVVKAIVFIGKQNRYKGQYAMYHKAGFELVYKDAVPYKDKDGKITMKANVDVDLTVGVLGTYIDQYDKAVIISGDGDFLPLYFYLKNIGKLKRIIVPSKKSYSTELNNQALKDLVTFMNLPLEKAEILSS